jgi:hypothetical protein
MTGERQVDHGALCYVFLLERHLPTGMFTSCAWTISRVQ